MATLTTSSTSIVDDDTEDYVIVLYYQYCTINDVKLTCQEQQQLCHQLSLLGRVRVAEEGLNGTLGGTSHNIEEYMRTVDSIDQFDAVRRPIHWKLSRLQDGVLHQRFTSLKVQAVKEVVSLDLPDTVRTAMQEVDPGIHITPTVWHEMLTKTTQSETTDEPILIDVRNLYETNIGKFIVDTPRGSLQPLDPGTRQFSDFAKYVDKEVENLKGKTVMMYCTGGVRCERASTYVRYAIEQAGGTADIYQLSGGIHAYMETYPQGGNQESSFLFCHCIQSYSLVIHHHIINTFLKQCRFVITKPQDFFVAKISFLIHALRCQVKTIKRTSLVIA